MIRFDRRAFIRACGVSAGASLLRGRAFAQPADPTELGIARAGELIRSRELSPSRLVEAYLARIEQLNPRLNAFITVMADQARARAALLEEELERGSWRGPLHGVPIGLKDNIDTAGVPTTAASAVFAGRVPDGDAEVVRRLDEAGAVVIGKLNMHEFAFGSTSAISHFGPVRNPWDESRIAGGSSGGSAAAVAARLCAGALGTDTGGSIRIPAAHCGIVGLKPTYGLASIRGIVPFSVSLDHVGPMCRTVEDAALLLEAIAGYDPRGVGSIDVDVPDLTSALGRDTSGLRVGTPRALFDGVEPVILEAITEALDVLRSLTAEVVDVALPALPNEGVELFEVYRYHAPLMEQWRELYQPQTLSRILGGADIGAEEYRRAQEALRRARAGVGAVFQRVDLLVLPTLPRLPVAVADAGRDPQQDRIAIRNTYPFNVFGVPAISVPCGFGPTGLPIGLQIAGPALGEPNVLALAHAYERITKWHEREPPLG